MTLPAKKYSLLFLASLWLALFSQPFSMIAQGAAARVPYSLSAGFYRADNLPLPGPVGKIPPAPALWLALTAIPDEPDLYLYASKSQAHGKPVEIGVFAEGVPIRSHALFPQGAEKPDPLRPGRMTRVFQGPFTALVPLPEEALAAPELTARLTGLTCSDVNCTPVAITARFPVPGVAMRETLPEAASAPWRAALQSGVVESLATTFPAEGSVSRISGLSPNLPPKLPMPGLARIDPFAPEPGAFLAAIKPASFTPGLEVSSIGKAVLLGFLAGIILNLMPCVLPVLGIKLAALLGRGGEERERFRRFRRHQLFFSGGILAWFTAMAGLFHFLDLAWGQIFQSPAVVLALAVLLLLLALNLFGVLSLPLIDLRVGSHKNPDMEAFASGFAATLLATPCGGPLLGGVLSWALLQPLGVLALTLESVGLGMAFPYLLLAAFPTLTARLPRPGPWMGVLEQILGFLLLGTVAYLVSFLPPGILPRVVPALVLVAFGGWLWGRSASGGAKRHAVRIFAVVCIAAACLWPFREPRISAVWTPYSHAALAEELGRRPVLVDFTADWCPTCKVVEATALADKTVAAWQKRYGAAFFRVDMTRENPEGEALLRAIGSVSIPVIAVFGTGGDAHAPLVLRDVVTRGQVETALKRASGGQGEAPISHWQFQN